LREEKKFKMTISHIALQCPNEKKANIFFNKILGLKQKSEFILPSSLSMNIFGIGKSLKVKVFSEKSISFEIFITKQKPRIVFEHICLFVENKQNLINKCKKYGIKILNNSNYKQCLFIRDFSGYLYEIKDKQKINPE